jgi:para-aminobenzoate synthetase component 1
VRRVFAHGGPHSHKILARPSAKHTTSIKNELQPHQATTCVAGNIASNFTKPNYINAIRRVQEYIAAGDVYQVNLSQRLQAECPCPADELYVRLRAINPAPRACLIELGDVQLVGASPESFLSYNPATRIIQTKPIKGTRPRGKSREEDIRLASELASSEKDRAENVMIVDMERNDLGKVASYGSVQVTKLWDIEEHPNVFQMVSTVEATLDPAYDVVDLLRATFPGGSITGAPKVRAMQIIEELEPHRRGLYTGAAGYIGFDGSIELNIIIRSFVIYDGIAYFHAGGGIVADSNPEMEYQETLDKVAGLVAAITGQVS